MFFEAGASTFEAEADVIDFVFLGSDFFKEGF